MFFADFLFIFLSALLIICALCVIVSRHPVFSLLFLVCCFLSASCLLFLLECEFLALLLITIYVGAIAILFLFSIMMLESKAIDLSKNSMKYIPISFFFFFLFLYPIWQAIDKTFIIASSKTLGFDNSNNYQNWYMLLETMTDIEVYGSVLYTHFVAHFLVAGLILLVVLIGVVYLTNNFNTKILEQSIFKQLSRTHVNIK